MQVGAGTDESAWELSVQRDGEGLSLRMTNPKGALRAVRRLKPTNADCATLPQSVALLVKSWLAMQLVVPADASNVERAETVVTPKDSAVARPEPNDSTAPRPETRAKSAARVETPTKSSASTTERPEARPAGSTSTRGGEPSVSAPVPDVLAAPPPPVEPPAPEPAAPEFFIDRPRPLQGPPPSTRSFSTIVAGGGALGIDDTPVGMGMLTVEWGFLEPWAVAIDAGLQTERRGTDTSGGAVWVSLRWATLSLRRSFFADGIQGLHLSLGVELVHLSARAQGISKEVLLPAAAANLEWRQALPRGLFLLARLNVQARYWPEAFTGPAGARVFVPAWGFGLVGGIGWNFL